MKRCATGRLVGLGCAAVSILFAYPAHPRKLKRSDGVALPPGGLYTPRCPSRPLPEEFTVVVLSDAKEPADALARTINSVIVGARAVDGKTSSLWVCRDQCQSTSKCGVHGEFCYIDDRCRARCVVNAARAAGVVLLVTMFAEQAFLYDGRDGCLMRDAYGGSAKRGALYRSLAVDLFR